MWEWIIANLNWICPLIITILFSVLNLYHRGGTEKADRRAVFGMLRAQAAGRYHHICCRLGCGSPQRTQSQAEERFLYAC